MSFMVQLWKWQSHINCVREVSQLKIASQILASVNYGSFFPTWQDATPSRYLRLCLDLTAFRYGPSRRNHFLLCS